jgi:hypothetical protein
LRVAGGKVVPRSGTEVHAAAFLKQRQLIFDSSLLGHAPELIRIFAHEVFDFVWTRIDNTTRKSWEQILLAERRLRVKGELGWSAQLYKDRATIQAGRRWRDYLCESFCDTAAWYFSGHRTHEEFTLPSGSRRRRKRWFETMIESRQLPL